MKEMTALILAAGQGKRMKSKWPKVLHEVLGKPLIHFPIELALRLKCSKIVVVVGHGREQVESEVRALTGNAKVVFAVQKQQLGTGHAVMSAASHLKGGDGPILILSGDVPLLDVPSINSLKKALIKGGGPLAFLSFSPEDPTGYGRVIRDDGKVVGICEESDCSKAMRCIQEVNSGVYIIDSSFLRKSIKNLKSNNEQAEFYLTDLVEKAAKIGEASAVQVSADIVRGVNDRADLAKIEEILSEQKNLSLMRSGVTIRKPKTVRIDLDVTIGKDTEIGSSVSICLGTKIGEECRIEEGAIISGSIIEDRAIIKAYSVVEDSEVKSGAEIGPIGRLRPGTIVKENAKVGNFVELKNTVLGKGSKANHLAYLGDGIIGNGVNVGAGTIFCNYDGFQKHKTILEDDVFIGSDSQLVAPLTVGKGAYIASGSTVTKNVPPDALAIARSRQENKIGVGAALKSRLKALSEAAKKAREENE